MPRFHAESTKSTVRKPRLIGWRDSLDNEKTPLFPRASGRCATPAGCYCTNAIRSIPAVLAAARTLAITS